jgi:alkylhydroperoxidase family enzyme
MLSASAAMDAAPRARTDADMMAIFFMPHQRRRSALVPALARGAPPETVPDASSRSVVSRRVRSLFRCLRCVFGKAASRRMKDLLQAQSLPSFRAAILPCGRFGRVVAVSGRLSFFNDQP